MKEGIKGLRHNFVELKSTLREVLKSTRDLAKEHRKKTREIKESNMSAIRGMTEQ